MGVITIDPKKCNKDGICAMVCPVRVIAWPDKQAPPLSTPEAGELCIDCGHCVAACPTGALSQRSMPAEKCPAIKPELAVSAEQAEQFLRSRRSIRLFEAKPVDRELLSRLIGLASFAPSGHNTQPVKWLAMDSPDKVNQMAGLVADWMRYLIKEMPEVASQWQMDRVVAAWEAGEDAILRGAPALVCAHAPKADLTAPPAGTIALAYLELAAPSLGLGACWAGYFNSAAGTWPPLQKALGLPEGEVPLGSMLLGRPKIKYHRLPLRKEPAITWK